MMIWLGMIPGFMLGLEWEYHMGMFIIDLGIIRVIIDYQGAMTRERISPNQKDDSTNH